MSLLLLLIGIFIISGVVKRNNYKRSGYSSESGAAYREVVSDKGKYGEYLTYRELESIKGPHKILTNVYIPAARGGTTEIDLIFIHESGIYVIESKNYSGWIFGNENNKYWTQVFKNQRKERFYNPIMQNNGHIRNLSRFLRLDIDTSKIKSIIVFSERCTLRDITVVSENVRVIKRNNLYGTIKSFIKKSDVHLTENMIDDIYSRLKVYCNVDRNIKESHINYINNKYRK